MSTIERIDGGAILDHTIDDLLLQARGLVLVREVLAQRGATRDELDPHTRERECEMCDVCRARPGHDLRGLRARRRGAQHPRPRLRGGAAALPAARMGRV